MVKKFLILSLMFLLIPFNNVNVEASVRDSENLIDQAWTYNIIGFPGELNTVFYNGIQTSGINSLTTDDEVKAEYIQIFWPYHPNLGLTVYPANDGTNAQVSIIYFNTGGSLGIPINLNNVFTTDTITTSIRRTNGGYSSIIEVPRDATSFEFILQANTETVTTVNAIKDLLDNEFTVQLVSNPNTISYPINPVTTFATSSSGQLQRWFRSSNNIIPANAVNELIIYIDNFDNNFIDDNTDAPNRFSYITFKNASGSTLQTVYFNQAKFRNQTTTSIDNYYVFDINTPTLNNATQFDITIRYINYLAFPSLKVQDSIYYNFDDQIHNVYFYNNFSLIKREVYSVFVRDLPISLHPQGHSFWEWINPETNTREVFDFSETPNQDIYLYSGNNGTQVINPPTPTIPGTYGGVYTPLDTILSNTGFLNTSGVMILYFISLSAILLFTYRFSLGSMVSTIASIIITALFMILGYLPVFAALIMIVLIITIIITMNKGGMLNE